VLTDPDTVSPEVEDAAFVSFEPTAANPGRNFRACVARKAISGKPVAGGMGFAHHICSTPKDPNRDFYVAISAAGVFRTEIGGKTWKPATKD